MNASTATRLRITAGLCALACAAVPAVAQDTHPTTAPAVTLVGPLPGPLPLFPSTNWWNVDISTAPVDPLSTTFINNFVGPARGLHPDMGGDVDPAPNMYGMPYIVVDGTQPKRTVTFNYSDESDGVDHATDQSFPFYPIPDEAITQPHYVEGGPPGNQNVGGDRHMLIVDRDNKFLYELFNVFYDSANGWQAGSGAFFDMKTNNRRPEGWTSADAAGLAILPGLLRYDEVFGSDEIRHALRVTMNGSNGSVYPASHVAGSLAGALPMGARLRLKPGVNILGFPPAMQKIFRAMKTYGLLNADNGSTLYITGTYDNRWDMDVLNSAFSAIKGGDFEVIQLGYQPAAAPPTISIGDVTIAEGQVGWSTASFPVTLSAASAQPVTVSYSTADGSATAGSDYFAAAGTLTFPPDVTSQMVTVTVVADRVFESDETFFVNVASPTNATIADAQAVGTITNDDAAGLTITDVSVKEPLTGTTTATFTVTLAPTSSGPVSVNYATANGTASAGSDYVATSGPLVFAPGTSTKTVSVTVNGDLVPEGNESFTVTLSSPVGAAIALGQGVGTIIDSRNGPDFNGDGRADILWRNVGPGGATGALFVWLMNGAGLAGATYLDPISSDWVIQKVGDFNGDGKADILWRNTSPTGPDSGNLYMWLMDGARLIGGGYPNSQANLTWQVHAVGDLNGDGKTDIVWRNVGPGVDTGALFVWLMDGKTIIGATYLDPIGTDWQIQRVGDLSGDGKADILWRNVGTGPDRDNLYVWIMNGPAVVAGTGYPNSQADATWQVQAIGDLNGDGKQDLVWRNVGPGAATGAMFLWLMDGKTIIGATYLDPISTDWQIQGTADFNGDGKADILWRNTRAGAPDVGNLYVWIMNGATVSAGTGYTGSQADLTWDVKNPR